MTRKARKKVLKSSVAIAPPRVTLPVLYSASEATRAKLCPASFVIGQVREESSVDANRGTTAHAFVRNVLSGAMTEEQALELVALDDPAREVCERIDFAALPRGGKCEPAFAWRVGDGTTARLLGYDIDRRYEEYGADRTLDVVGSGDYVAKVDHNVGVLADLKFGRYSVEVEGNDQLETLAFMAADHLGVSEMRTAIIQLPDGRPKWKVVTLGPMQLAAARERARQSALNIRSMKEALDASPTSAPVLFPYAEGDHCRYCPAWKRCAAKTALLRVACEAFGSGFLEVMPETVGAVSLAVDQYDAVMKRLRKEIEAYVSMAGDVARPDGSVLRLEPGRASDVVVNGPEAIAVLEEQLDEAAARMAVQTTKGAIEQAARDWALRNGAKIGATQDAVIDVMRKRSVVQHLPGEMGVRVVKPKKAEIAS